MRLAEVFGEPDWNIVLEKLDPWQYMLYRAKDLLEGIGTKRDDRRAAEMTAWLLTSQGFKDITVDKLAFDITSQVAKSNGHVATHAPTKESTRAALFAVAGVAVPPTKKRQSQVKRGK